LVSFNLKLLMALTREITGAFLNLGDREKSQQVQ